MEIIELRIHVMMKKVPVIRYVAIKGKMENTIIIGA